LTSHGIRFSPEEGFSLDLALFAPIKDKSRMEAIYDHKLKVLRSSIREAKSKSKADIHTYALAVASAASVAVTLFIVVSFMFMR
jgi:hypothetical protein